MIPAQTLLITGASRGLGWAAAKQAAGRGVRVIIGVRNLEAGKAAAAKIGPLVTAISLDVTSDASVAAAVEAAGRLAPGLDALIHNAAVLLDGEATAATLSPRILGETLETNLIGPLRVTQGFLPLLRRSRQPRVIHVASEAGQLAGGIASWAPAYSISKTALNMLTQQLAAALPGVAVNSMCPGWCRTEMGGPSAPRSPEEGADTMIWLALDAPQSLTGQFLRDRKPLDW